MPRQSRFFCDILHLFSHVYVTATAPCGNSGLIKVEEAINHGLCIVKLVANIGRCGNEARSKRRLYITALSRPSKVQQGNKALCCVRSDQRRNPSRSVVGNHIRTSTVRSIDSSYTEGSGLRSRCQFILAGNNTIIQMR